MALLDLENGAEAVNWHVEVTETHAPKVKLTALMRSPSDPPVPITPEIDRNHDIYRERDSQRVEKSHIFAWTRPPRVMEALR
jgi:hypothetical protein